MYKLVRKIFTFSIVFFVGLMISIFYVEIVTLNETTTEMDSLIRRGNRYCVQQAQDIDIVKEQILTEDGSKNAYRVWLAAMSSYNGFTKLEVKNNAVTSTNLSSGLDKDAIITEDIIPFLQEDFDSRDSKGYTPLNFGMTYLDPLKLEKDMEFYLKTNIRDFNNYFSAGKSGMYRVDPYTIDVDVELEMKPVRIDELSNSESKEAYMTMFGTSIPEELMDSSTVDRSEIKTIIKYNIIYKVRWDYIPTSIFFKVKAREAQAAHSGNKPDDWIYLPKWYDKDGNVTGNDTDAVAKFIRTKPLQYKFEYVLTH